MKRSFFDPEPEPRKKKSSKKVKKAEADPLELKRDEDALVLLQNFQTLDVEPFKRFEREMEQIQAKANLVKDFTVGGDPTTIGGLESRLYDTKSSIRSLVLNQIDNLDADELRIDQAKKGKLSTTVPSDHIVTTDIPQEALMIEEIVKDFRAIVNEFMLKLENCKKKFEDLKSEIELFQSERLMNADPLVRKRAEELSEKIKMSIKEARGEYWDTSDYEDTSETTAWD